MGFAPHLYPQQKAPKMHRQQHEARTPTAENVSAGFDTDLDGWWTPEMRRKAGVLPVAELARERIFAHSIASRQVLSCDRSGGRHRRASRSAPARSRGSRRRAPSSSSDDPGGDAEGDGDQPSPVSALAAPWPTEYGGVTLRAQSGGA